MKTFLSLLLSSVCTFLLQAQTTVLEGTVTESGSNEILIGATVKISRGAEVVKMAVTDVDGNYRITLDPGTYDVEVSYTGFSPAKITGMKALSGQVNRLNITLSAATALTEVVVVGYIAAPKSDVAYCMASTQTAKQPKKSEKKSGKKSKGTDSGQVNIKGSRSVGNKHYVGDVQTKERRQKTNSQNIPVNESSSEQYNRIVENQYVQAKDASVSTFSIDVDGAAYANARRFLSNGNLPPQDAVRVEEFVNYFDYQYQQPTDGKPFAVHTELAKCPWNAEHQLLSIALQGRDIETGQLPASNFVFLVDVSGSMNEVNKLPLVKQSLQLLTDYLRPQDRVALVVYAGAAGLVLPSTPGNQKEKIKDAIEKLGAGGGTAGAAGIQLAYQTARSNLAAGGNNRVVLCTDGDFNVGVSSENELIQLIEKERESGIYLSVLGFGMGNYQDGKMQQLANKGNGNHSYIDQLAEAKKVLVNEFGGTLFTIAKDVKIQLDFNADKVAAYRLVGYENRLLNKEDFDDDTKDAGELGAGHRVTALYEIIPAGQDIPVAGQNGDFQFQKTKSGRNSKGGDLLTLKLRFKQPRSTTSELIKTVVTNTPSETMSENLTLAAAAASFGMVLRNSPFKGNASLQSTLELAEAAAKNDPNGYRSELCRLIKMAQTVR